MLNLRKLLFIPVALILGICAASPSSTQPSSLKHFTWGAEIGGTIDMTSNDMSAFSLDAFFGYRNSWIKMLGVGTEIQSMVNESKRTFPIYAIFRSSFSSRPSLCFMSLKIGGVLNDLQPGKSQGSLFVAPALGINLAKGQSFQSYVTLGYSYNSVKIHEPTGKINGLHMATITLGISF